MLRYPSISLETTLSAESIRALLNREIDLIRVPHFYQRGLCDLLSKKMLSIPLYGTYTNAPLIGRIGQAFFETTASDKDNNTYWDNSIAWVRELRTACYPYLTPIDKLRLELDEAWPAGSTIASLNGNRMFVGLGRVFQAGGYAEPHQDILAWDAPDSREAAMLKGQLAVNTYLKLPEHGGELKLWRVELSKDEYATFKNPGSYGVDIAKLPPASQVISISPVVGELIMFDSRRVHAVEPSFGGCRITWSNFVGYSGEDSPLQLWS